jgi:hypothetical protein
VQNADDLDAVGSRFVQNEVAAHHEDAHGRSDLRARGTSKRIEREVTHAIADTPQEAVGGGRILNSDAKPDVLEVSFGERGEDDLSHARQRSTSSALGR